MVKKVKVICGSLAFQIDYTTGRRSTSVVVPPDPVPFPCVPKKPRTKHSRGAVDILKTRKLKTTSEAVTRKKVVSTLKNSRDRSFLFSGDHEPEKCKSPTLKSSKETRIKKPKICSQTLRKKIERIKYSRDYSFLFPDVEPTSPPLKVSEEGSKQTGSKTTSPVVLQETVRNGMQISCQNSSAINSEELDHKKLVTAQLDSEKEGSRQNVNAKVERLDHKKLVTAQLDSEKEGSRQNVNAKIERLDKNNKVNTQLCSKKTAEEGERKRLVLRWKITPDGRGKLIKDSNLDKNSSVVHHGANSEGKLDERTLSFINEIFKTIFKVESLDPKISRKRDVKAIKSEEETSRQRFKIHKPRWKRICKPKISLGAPRLSSRYVACRKDGAF